MNTNAMRILTIAENDALIDLTIGSDCTWEVWRELSEALEAEKAMGPVVRRWVDTLPVLANVA